MIKSVEDAERVEKALRVLEGYGVEVKGVWQKLAREREEWDAAVAPEVDRVELAKEPPGTEGHFADGRAEVLSIERMWIGLSYRLSAGQRVGLKEKYGLTPAKTMTVESIVKWPGTNWPRSVKLVSDEHVNPKLRRHTLTSVVLREVGEFFAQARAWEVAQRESKRAGETNLVPSAVTVGRRVRLLAEDRWAVEDLTGVKVSTRCTVIDVTEADFTLACERTEGFATVGKEEFFKTVREYKGAAQPTRKAGGGDEEKTADALDDVIKGLFGVE